MKNGGVMIVLLAILIVLLVILVILGVCCCKEDKRTEPDVKSRFVVVTYGTTPEECVVVPESRIMDSVGHVTFLNLTEYDATIEFIDANAVDVGTSPFTIGQDEFKTLALKQPGTTATYGYKVSAVCYTPTLPGPIVLIP